MIARQHDHPACRLRHHVVRILAQRAHHQAADENRVVLHCRAARPRQQLAKRRPHWRPERLRLPHRTAHREKFPRHRPPLLRLVDVVQRLHVIHYATHLQGDARRRNQPPGRRVDQFVLIARRIKIAQHDKLDPAPAIVVLESFQRLRVLGLDAELAGFRSHGVHHRRHAGQNFRREMLHQLGVFVNQRLAFGAVGDHEFHLRLRFDIRREAGPAGAHHAQFAQLLAEHTLEDSKLL